MENKTSFWQKNIREVATSLTSFFQNSWPINWNNFKNPKILFNALLATPYFLKTSLVVFTVVFIISFSFFSSGLYQILTVEVASEGGQFREILLQDKIQRLNPVLESTSEAEKKITSLLYHPLYRVTFPDFSKTAAESPKITPVLLDREPEWITEVDTNQVTQYKALKFTLKKDLKWSDGSELKVSDIIYSFERIREDKGNQDFHDLFANFELIGSATNKLEFEIRPNKVGVLVNPNLKYLSNFSPISEKFYDSAKNSDLISNLKSLQPVVSSGYFTFPQRVQDPDSTSNKELENPIRRDFNDYSLVVLERNSIQNSNEKLYLDKYIFKFVNSVNDTGGQNASSLELESKQKKADLFSRFLSPGQAPDSKAISVISGLEQKILTTNTYFSFFVNSQPSSGGLESYFVNQALRKYVICQVINSSFSEIGNKALMLNSDKRLLPLSFEEKYNADCTNNQEQLLEEKNTRGAKIYTIASDDRTNIKQLKIFNRTPKITMLALEEFRGFGEIVQAKLQEIGIPVSVNWVNSGSIDAAIKQKNYHFLFLPITMIGNNLYPVFGTNGRNVSNISKNDRFNGKGIETTLKNFSDSNYANQEAKDQLLDFFKNQFLSANLFQTLYEVNYSNRVNDLAPTIRGQITFSSQLYFEIPKFYTQTKRNYK